jgi:hypothetical protein
MTLRRHDAIAFLLLTAVVCVYFSPLIPFHAGPRHHQLRDHVVAAAISFTGFLFAATFQSFTPSAPEQRALFPQGLYELHCARLC